ncbi:hypothetical protein Anas_03180 [Armadillidium nasatum]|uniref:Voltage-dependent calcium channel alpha-1 subunit IQ domain-containing protein n=1 Tax=Armadillidium nasatum TaxID=96803 RepID=A0A5N5SWF2_9CRUS|nr:hypothetical protein Anas_03180 [Armadillidium nasatum]
MRPAEEMDQADSELRVTIRKLWPIQAKKNLDIIVPPNSVLRTQKMTVGKIYALLLILENWRTTRFGQIQPAGLSNFEEKNYIDEIDCHFVSIDENTDLLSRPQNKFIDKRELSNEFNPNSVFDLKYRKIVCTTLCCTFQKVNINVSTLMKSLFVDKFLRVALSTLNLVCNKHLFNATAISVVLIGIVKYAIVVMLSNDLQNNIALTKFPLSIYPT